MKAGMQKPEGQARAVRGYVLVAGAFLIMGIIGTLVSWTTAPESALLVIRFSVAGLVLRLFFARKNPLKGIRQPGVAKRLLLMGLCDALSLLLFFVAIRITGVAVGMFLMFLAPVWIALAAPRVFHTRTETVIYPALVLALLGLLVILAPSLGGGGAALSPGGVAIGLAAGLGYAAFQLLVKDLTGKVSATTIVFAEVWIDALALLPLALVQTVGAGYILTANDLVASIVLGVVCTALAYMLYTTGMGMIKVQHSSILGFLEPVSAPIYALLVLGQDLSPWTIAGGALIVAAGILVVVIGEREAPAGT